MSISRINLLKAIYVKFSQLSVILPIIAGYRNREALTKPFKVLLYFFVFTLLIEIQGSIAIEIWHNNMPGQHLLTLVQFLVFSTVFYLEAQKNSIARIFICIIAIGSIVVAMADIFYFEGIKEPNTYSRGYSSALMTLYALVYFYYLFQKDDTRYAWQYPMFWVCTGMLVYFGGNALYATLKSYLLERAESLEKIFNLGHVTLNLISSFLYAQSFRCLKKNTTSQ